MRRASSRADVALVIGFAAWVAVAPPHALPQIDLANRPVVSVAGPTAVVIARLPYQRGAEAALVVPNSALAVVRVGDGKILALASSAKRGPASLAYQFGYPPGSSLKPYIYGSAVDAGKLGDHEFLAQACGGSWEEALARSCNGTALIVAKRLGAGRLNRLVDTLGSALARSRGGLGPASRWARARNGDTASIEDLTLGGGGTRVTPLHLATLMAGIANGGRVGGVRIMSAKAARLVTEALIAAADHGTGARLHGMHAATKTGTVTELRTKDGWISGFWPADAPRLAFSVIALGSAKQWVIGHDAPTTIASQFLQQLNAAA